MWVTYYINGTYKNEEPSMGGYYKFETFEECIEDCDNMNKIDAKHQNMGKRNFYFPKFIADTVKEEV